MHRAAHEASQLSLDNRFDPVRHPRSTPSIYETGRSELSKNRVFTVSSSMVPCVIMEWLVANSISPAGLSGRLKQISNALNEFPPAVRLGNYAARTCSYCQGAAHGIVIHRE
jgi:hypothetical protein